MITCFLLCWGIYFRMIIKEHSDAHIVMNFFVRFFFGVYLTRKSVHNNKWFIMNLQGTNFNSKIKCWIRIAYFQVDQKGEKHWVFTWSDMNFVMDTNTYYIYQGSETRDASWFLWCSEEMYQPNTLCCKCLGNLACL